MSNQHVLDPRLGAGLPPPASYGNLPTAPPPPPPQFAQPSRTESLKSDAGYRDPQQSPAQPYYYPSPQEQQTPQSQAGSAYKDFQASHDNSPHVDYTNDSPRQDNNNSGDQDDPKRPRACEACRGLKVRCDQDPAHPEIPCKRCSKAGRQCVITQPSRKRQKKADSRVAELEKKLDALTQALHQQQGGAVDSSGPYPNHSAAPNAYARGSTGSVPTFQHPGAYPLNNGMAGPTSAGARPASASPITSNKRRRTEESAPVTETLDGADETVHSAISRDPSPLDKALAPGDYTLGSGPDLFKFLHNTTPEAFVARINKIVTPALAKQLFSRYTEKLAPHLPAVVFPPGTTAEQVFQEKPILYLCILSAASSGILSQEDAKVLSHEAIGAIADCVVRYGAKSLELIQAMQILTLWYKPPEQAQQTNFYQIIHMAAVMALDIGLGKRFNAAKARRGFGGTGAAFAPGPGAKMMPQDSDTIEARRAWLGCYYMCASASMVLRRPNLIHWTNYMKESIEVLESSPDAFPSDRFFVQHVKIQHICEEIGLQFLMDDSSANISISDPKVSYALNVLEKQLKDWDDQVPANLRSPGLTFFSHVTSLYLHEIALHFNHNVDDFRLPFTEESLRSVNNATDTLTANQMSALDACLKAAHGILDTILSFEVDFAKTLPMLLYFVRCVYAIVILIKMHVAVSIPGSEVGKLMKPEDLRVDYYLNGLIGLFREVANRDGADRRNPKVLRILGVLKEWFDKHKEGIANQQTGGLQARKQSIDQGQNSRQTPLHVLSQAATLNDASSSQQQGPSERGDWTFDNATPINYNNAMNNASMNGPGMPAVSVPYDAQGMPMQDNPGMFDPANPSDAYGWGSGFEQAMDIALGGMDGLAGGDINNWFLGDSTAPFQFPVEGGMTGW